MKSVVFAVCCLFFPSLEALGIGGWSVADVATARVKVEAVFDYYDVNSDGSLKMDDFQHVLDAIEKYNSYSDDKKAELKTFLTNWWTNDVKVSAEKALTKEQFVAAIFTLIGNGHQTDVTMDYRSNIFDLIDNDKNGEINLSEFLEFAKALGHTCNVKQTKAFNKIDKSGNGLVTWCEYVTAYVLYMTDPTVTYDALPLF